MTFKEYLKTPHAKKRIKSIIKNKNLKALPQCNKSQHIDSSTMLSNAPLPAASPVQPSLS